jgi:hypothetical protein
MCKDVQYCTLQAAALGALSCQKEYENRGFAQNVRVTGNWTKRAGNRVVPKQ